MQYEQNVKDFNDIIALPTSLEHQFRLLKRRLWFVETVATVTGGLCGVIAAFLLLFVVDRLTETPKAIRLLLAGSAVGVLSWCGIYWVKHWVLKPRTIKDLAIIVQRRFSQLGDRLLSAVELAEPSTSKAAESNSLRLAAINQVSQEVVSYDLRKAISSRVHILLVMLFIIFLIVTAVIWSLFPEASHNSLLRMVYPLSEIKRYTFVKLEPLPASLIVPHGENFDITCKIMKDSKWYPQYAFCKINKHIRLKEDIINGLAMFNIPPQVVPSIVRIVAGDAYSESRIIPTLRPELNLLDAEIVLPEYTGQPPLRTHISGSVNLLSGSTVKFIGHTSRELRHARMSTEGILGNEDLTLTISTNKFISPLLRPEISRKYTFTWTDKYGLTSKQPYIISVHIISDTPPQIDWHGHSTSIVILEDEITELCVIATDDYGIRDINITWVAEGKKLEEKKEGVLIKAEGSPATKKIIQRAVFSPLAFHIPEDSVVTLVAHAVDYFPGRAYSDSPLCRIYVLNKVQHAKMIQERMENLQIQLEEMANEEERLSESHESILNDPSADLKSEKIQNILKNNELAEHENANKLERLGREASDILQQAVRNRDIPPETLSTWSKIAHQLKSIRTEEMAQAIKALSQAVQTSENRRSNIEKTAQMEKEMVKQLREMGKNANNTVEDMFALNFVNRLMAVATGEAQITQTLTQMIPEIVGKNKNDLSRSMSEKLSALAQEQANLRKQAGYIQDDLYGFYNRTRKEIYNTIAVEMDRSNMREELKSLVKLIESNMAFQSLAKTEKWETQFKTWAEMLKKKSSSSQDGKTGEIVELSESDIHVLISLIRARKGEEILREQTRTVEETKAENANYLQDTKKLASAQNALADEIRPLERRSKNFHLRMLVEKIVGEMMNATVMLRKPQTDSATIAIQTEIIELLANAISMSEGASGANGAALAAMFGYSGITPGTGNRGGGTTDKPNIKVQGSTNAPVPESKTTPTTGGLFGDELPLEFRESLQFYFNAIEENKNE
jgi:hypothetical protein